MLILNAADVKKCLSMREAIEATKSAFAALVEQRALVPLRAHLPIEKHQGITLVMPAYIAGDDEALALKVVSVYEGNVQKGLPMIQAAVIVLDPATGEPLALLEGATLTGIRTAAASGAATDLLARKDSRTLAIFGAGVQARTHIEAICAVRPIETVTIFSRTPEKVDRLIAELSGGNGSPRTFKKAATTQAAVAEADIVCTTTTSSTPVFDDDDLKPGVHINAVGSSTAGAREVPPETVLRAYVVVDDRAVTWTEAGDLIQPLEAGLIRTDHVRAELGELALNIRPARENDDQITFFKSVGVAVQDAAAAQVALRNAQSQNLGQKVDW